MMKIRYASLIALFLLPAVYGYADYKFEWKKTDESLALLNDGKTVWQFNRGTDGSKPYFHPIGLVDGTVLTAPRPLDHPWHLALWFSLKYINKMNYWEESRETKQAEGQTHVAELSIDSHDDFSAKIDMTLEYRPRGGDPLLTETRRIDIAPPDEQGNYYIDWDAHFTVGKQDVVLDRTPILGQPHGQPNGGYCGLSVRFTQQAKDAQVANSSGVQNMNIGDYRLGTHAPWLDYTIKVDGGKTAGIAIFDHPGNFRHPSPWYAIVNPEVPFHYFNAAFIYDKPLERKAGDTFELRYRILVHEGRTNVPAMEKAYQALQEAYPEKR